MALREEIGDYLIGRVGGPWMRRMMMACQEISAEDLERASVGECSSKPPAAVAAAVASHPIVIDDPADQPPAIGDVPAPPPPTMPVLPPEGALEEQPPLPPPLEAPPRLPPPLEAPPPLPAAASESAVAGDAGLHGKAIARSELAVADDAALRHKAIKWATNVQDSGLLASICCELPDAVLQQQVRSDLAAEDAPANAAVAAADEHTQIVVRQELLTSRLQVAEAFHNFLTSGG